MTNHLAGAVVILVGSYLCALGVAAFVAPAMASRFLRGFAQSASTHFLELGLRILVGIALVLRAPSLPFELIFSAVGWMIMITSLALLAVPWRWHRRFAERFVPPVTRHLRWFGLASLLLGGLILAAVWRGAR